MFNKRKLFYKNDDEQDNFWPSIGDLFSTVAIMFLIFLLLSKIELEDFKSNNIEGDIEKEVMAKRYEIISEIKEKMELQNYYVNITPDNNISFPSKILFDFNKATLKKDAQQLIEKLGEVLKPIYKKHKDYIQAILITGYTDDIGRENYNYNLSYRRALAVKLAMSKYFKNKNLLLAIGRGEEGQIKTDAITIEEKAINRRVEIHIQIEVKNIAKDLL